MKPNDMLDTLTTLMREPETAPSVIVSGPPGVGKTALVAQAAQAAGQPLYALALPTCEAVDLRGLPVVRDGRTVWCSPWSSLAPGVLLLDELSSAASDVQAAAHHLLWRETGSDMALGPGWVVVATGNRGQDRTHYRALSAPVRGRAILLDLSIDAGEWCSWALGAGVRAEVVGFIRWRPALLATPEIPAEGAYPSPRAWARLSALLALPLPAEAEIFAGVVGPGAATEFRAYLHLARQLPSAARCMEHPLDEPVPADPGTRYALAAALACHSIQTGCSAMPYVRRLPAEIALVYIRDIRDSHAEILRDCPAFAAWCSEHSTMFEAEA